MHAKYDDLVIPGCFDDLEPGYGEHLQRYGRLVPGKYHSELHNSCILGRGGEMYGYRGLAVCQYGCDFSSVSPGGIDIVRILLGAILPVTGRSDSQPTFALSDMRVGF